METITPYLPQEVANVWRLWKAGIVRENYARADESGVVIVFECKSVEQCKRYTDDFPLTKAGLIQWSHIRSKWRCRSKRSFDRKSTSTNRTIERRPRGLLLDRRRDRRRMMQRAYGLDIPSSLDDLCDPRRMALIVYDMQVGIVSQIADGTTITDHVVEVIEAARFGGFRVLYTRHMYLPKEIAGVCQLRTAMAWQRVDRVSDLKQHFLRDSAEFGLIPELTPLRSEAVFDKITMSAFVGTPLDIVLRDCGIESFAIVGIALEIGIEPTARHAMDLGYVPILVSDACGSGDETAAARSLASLAGFGGSFQTDVKTIGPLLRRAVASPKRG